MFGEPVFKFMLPLFRASVRRASGGGTIAADRVERLYVIDVFLSVELQFGRQSRDDASASGTSDEGHGSVRDRRMVGRSTGWIPSSGGRSGCREGRRGVGWTFHSSSDI